MQRVDGQNRQAIRLVGNQSEEKPAIAARCHRPSTHTERDGSMHRTKNRSEYVGGGQIDHHEPIGQMLADRSYHVRAPLAPQYSAEGKMDGPRGGQGGIGDASLQ